MTDPELPTPATVLCGLGLLLIAILMTTIT